MGIVEAIVGIVATAAIGSIGAGTVGLSVLGASMVAGVIYGGNAIVKGLSGKKESYSSSPTYQFNTLQTQTNNQLPIPIIYGENKIAGNRLWQQYRNNNTIIDRIIAFGEGEIDSISE
jgi:predicted phage tail protein